MSLTYAQLLGGNRNFRNLWLGQVVSELGNWFNFIAGLGLVRVVSGAAPEAAAILLVARTAPFALFMPLAGALVDRTSRRAVMLVTDYARAVVALGFLLVDEPGDLWIAYLCSVILALLSAFFDAAKNAAMPNVTGDDGLLAGNALMFSSRFLLMSIGAALGGAASAFFGYEIAFIINAVSFLVSAYSIWLIPGDSMHSQKPKAQIDLESRVASVFRDMKDGWSFIRGHSLVLTIIGVNIIWAIGGGAINLISDRLGGVVFAGKDGWSADGAVAAIYTAAGLGLFIGMILARRVGDFVERRNLVVPFIGWTLVIHGILYAIAGFMPNLWLVMALMMVSRVLLGVEYAVQETMLMRAIPDDLRGRVMTTDRAAEISVFSVSNLAGGWSLYMITPQMLTAISGILSAVSGLFWFFRVSKNKLSLQKAETKPMVEAEA
ncbi:MAG: MFS transporter [Acidobacteriota bacterium]|nr:MFS transporter [Acidobacteriota bacterium]